MQTIDFSPLKSMSLQKSSRTSRLNLLQFLGLLITVPIALLLASLILIALFSASPIFVALLFMTVMTYAVWKAYRQNARDQIALQQFVELNGWEMGGTVPTNPVLETLGFGFSSPIITGVLDEQPFWVHGLSVPTVDERSHMLDTLCIELPKPLPTILVLPGVGQVAAISNFFAKDRFDLVPLRLEGDFDAKARAYCAKDHEAEALEYLTPDVMRVIADKTTNVIFYADHYLYISPTLFQGADKIQSTFENAQALLKEVKEKQHIN